MTIKDRKYHVGDEVEITKPSNPVVGWNKHMDLFIGREGRITQYSDWNGYFCYRIDIDDERWLWAENYLLPVAPIEDVPDVAADISELYPWLTV